MNILQALILGVVQGLTEFLPVSSSGHLVLLKNIMGINEIPIFFDVMLHVGTLVAVCIVLFGEIVRILRHPIKNHLGTLIIATIPAAALGFLFNDFFTAAFEGQFLGYSFLLTAVILVLSEIIAERITAKKSVTLKSSLVMGGMQALAILPGISRSGSTIAGGLFCGVDRKQAANFAFLMSIPIILGSALSSGKDVLETGLGNVTIAPIVVGTIAAAASGFFAVKFMISLIQKKKLYGFAIYVAILGALVLLDQFAFNVFFTNPML